MRSLLQLAPVVAVAALLLACSGSNKPAASSIVLSTARPTAPPAQSGPVAEPTPDLSLATPQPEPADVKDLTDQVKFKITQLPRGFSVGQFPEAFQANAQAVSGYENPQAVLDRMNATGRLGGILQQIITPLNPAGAGITVEVWKDAAGAEAYFDQFPRPEPGVKYSEFTPPKQVGDQTFAIRYEVGGSVGYVISWRRGRLILGIGDAFPPGKESVDELMSLVDILDQNAQAAKQ
jgi:hypothetical protein